MRRTTLNSRRSRVAVSRQSQRFVTRGGISVRLDDANGLVRFETHGQAQCRQGHELRLGGGVELLTGLRPLDLGAQDDLALDHAFALEFASIGQAGPRAARASWAVRRKASLLRTL